MKDRFTGHTLVVLLFWFLALITIPIWGALQQPVPGWDLRVYINAIHSLQAGHDPYIDGIAVQRAFHQTPDARNPDIMPPYTYVYSPLTLPLLAKIGSIPFRLSGVVYGALYLLSMIAIALVGAWAAEGKERYLFALFAPAAMFFPGLLQAGVILSGNIAYLAYALVLTAALVGWHRNQWTWFYLAVLAASCCKAPLLSLIAIPILSARKQWLPAALAGVAGIGLFAVQPVLWPAAFHNYLQAIELQFSYNHDFGLSPAGILGNILFLHGIPYSPATTICYLLYAIPLFALLLYLSRRFLAGHFTLGQWIPVMLLGVVLLNPRIKEYDVAPLAIPMTLIAWRLFSRSSTPSGPILKMSLFFAAINAVAIAGPGDWWKPEACLVLIGLFSAGCWNLLKPSALEPTLTPRTPEYQFTTVS